MLREDLSGWFFFTKGFSALFFSMFTLIADAWAVRTLFVGCLPYLPFNKITVERGKVVFLRFFFEKEILFFSSPACCASTSCSFTSISIFTLPSSYTLLKWQNLFSHRIALCFAQNKLVKLCFTR